MQLYIRCLNIIIIITVIRWRGVPREYGYIVVYNNNNMKCAHIIFNPDELTVRDYCQKIVSFWKRKNNRNVPTASLLAPNAQSQIGQIKYLHNNNNKYYVLFSFNFFFSILFDRIRYANSEESANHTNFIRF